MTKHWKDWCDFNPKSLFKDFDSLKILEFFLWKNPVPGVSYGAKTFEEYGISMGYHYSNLVRILLKRIPPEIPLIEVFVDKNPMEQVLSEHVQHPGYSFKEIAIVVESDSKVRQMFRAIRHSLAHGSCMKKKHPFSKEVYYFFENRDPNDGFKLKARIVLKQSTLLGWINHFNSLQQK